MNTAIIIPVHGQKDLLARCISSVVRMTTPPFVTTLVDDGSDADTRIFCRRLKDTGVVEHLVRNDKCVGFTQAVNQGRAQCQNSDFDILLNSDTEIGTKGWNAELYAACNGRGLAGPVSNNATIQSVLPAMLPAGWRSEDAGGLMRLLATDGAIEVGFLNGFCYGITRSVFEKFPELDAKVFPHYGSEDDYTLRAAKAGFPVVVAPTVFVHHFGNKSYGAQGEIKHKAYSIPKLLEIWGAEFVMARSKMSEDMMLLLRQRVNMFFKCYDLRRLYAKSNS